MKEKTFVKNTVVLFVSMLISKIVGALFKIPLTNIIGGTGMGYYSTAYSIYTPVFALTASGIPTVIIRQIAENIARKNYKNGEKIIKVALILFGVMGIVGTLFIILTAGVFSDYVADSHEGVYAVIAIAPSVFFCCLSAVLKGYYEGYNNMVPSAVSQILESITRAVVGLSGALLVTETGKRSFYENGTVFGMHCDTIAEATERILPFSAAIAIFAVTISELVCLVCMLVRRRFMKKVYPGDSCRGIAEDNRTIARRLIKELVPIALAAIAVNLSSFIDMITIPRCISYAISEDSGFFTTCFSHIIGSGMGSTRLSNFIYGSYTGVAITVFMLVPSFTGMIGRSALPEIAAAWSAGKREEFSRKLKLVLKSNFLIGFPLYFGMAAFAPTILEILYAGRPDEVSVCVLPLFILSAGGVFLTLSSTFYSVFQVIGRTDIPIKLTLVASAVKLVLNVFLISVPQININGAAISTFTAYAVSALGGYLAIEVVTGIDFRIFSCLRLPLVAAVTCAVSAKLCEGFIAGKMPVVVSFALCTVVGMFIYFIFMTINNRNKLKILLNRRKNKKMQK
ncbi:MAG: polysaccharide biosynthesis protein [Ruminiclostridium sp.]|nr:polysaccharide biosynthesis protein [Ruminiclostridium sp.]